MITKSSIFFVKINFNKGFVITVTSYSLTKPSKIKKQKLFANRNVKFISKTNNVTCLFFYFIVTIYNRSQILFIKKAKFETLASTNSSNMQLQDECFFIW